MSVLAKIDGAVAAHNRFVEQQVKRVRSDRAFRAGLLRRWKRVKDGIPDAVTPTGLKLPRLAVPPTDDPGEIARYLFGEGMPGEFPFVNAAYAEMYASDQTKVEEPT